LLAAVAVVEVASTATLEAQSLQVVVLEEHKLTQTRCLDQQILGVAVAVETELLPLLLVEMVVRALLLFATLQATQ
jgi:hypothetical protein